jgi:hypothetical protein
MIGTEGRAVHGVELIGGAGMIGETEENGRIELELELGCLIGLLMQ